MASEKKMSGLTTFKDLWRPYDSVWLKDRQAIWKKVPKEHKSSFSKSGLKAAKLFFLEGRYEQYLPPGDTFPLVPFSVGQDMNKVFYSEFYTAEDRKAIFHSSLDQLHKVYPQNRNILDMFIKHIMGRHWKRIVESRENGRGEVEISWSPDQFVSSFLTRAKTILVQKRDANYSPFFDCLPYFYSCLENSEYSELLAIERLDAIFEIIEKLKTYPQATQNSLEVAAWLEAEKDKMYRHWPSSN